MFTSTGVDIQKGRLLQSPSAYGLGVGGRDGGTGSAGLREGGRAVQMEGQVERGDPLGVVAFLYPRAEGDTEPSRCLDFQHQIRTSVQLSSRHHVTLFTSGKRTPTAVTGVFFSSLGCCRCSVKVC